jgi:GT2 family glycosyltransferase
VLVSICVSTYKRPAGLSRLLEGLDRLSFRTLETPRIEVVVVDNEAAGAAAAVCARLEAGFRWTLRCADEPRRGITYARNRGLELAHPKGDFIAFIDDDEVPDTRWLEELLLARDRHEADIVSGPVAPRFESPPPDWVTRGGFFEARQAPEGQPLGVAFTNNVLLRSAVPREMDRAFDHRFALTGGEDTDFFMRARKAGYRMVWAPRALVYETIPASRTTAAWLLRRGYREWGSHSLSESALYPSLAVRGLRVLKATALVTLGAASLPLGAVLGRHRLVKSALLVSRGLGSFAGLAGRQYAEYGGEATGDDDA